MSTDVNLLITDDDQLAALGAVLAERPNRRPGWMDARQIMTRYGMTRRQVLNRMEALVQAGRAETAIVYDQDARRAVRVWRMI